MKQVNSEATITKVIDSQLSLKCKKIDKSIVCVSKIKAELRGGRLNTDAWTDGEISLSVRSAMT